MLLPLSAKISRVVAPTSEDSNFYNLQLDCGFDDLLPKVSVTLNGDQASEISAYCKESGSKVSQVFIDLIIEPKSTKKGGVWYPVRKITKLTTV